MKRLLNVVLAAGLIMVLSGCAKAPVPVIRAELLVETTRDIAIQKTANLLPGSGYKGTKVKNSEGIISTQFTENKNESSRMEMPIREKAVIVVKQSAEGTVTIGVSVVMESKKDNQWVAMQEGDSLCQRATEKSESLARKLQRAIK